MADSPGWVTTQFRVREGTHAYLAAQAEKAGISITQAAGLILEYARREGFDIGPVTITRQPAVIAERAGQA